MFSKNLKWLWNISALVCKHEAIHLKRSFKEIRIIKHRLLFMVKAVPLMGLMQNFMYPRTNSPLQRAMAQRPELLGVIIWPYVCASWPAEERLRRVEEHFKAIETMDAALDFPQDQALQLLDLEEVVPGLKVALDQPKWFIREGLLVISLFISNKRIFALAFSLAFESGRVVVYVGAIQGVEAGDNILEEYKNLTKDMHGMRPGDFLVEVFRILCRRAEISRIFAVSNDKRQYQSDYFGGKRFKVLLDYNKIWLERGGVRNSEDFFILPLETPIKNLADVSSNKRAMYRRRYELLQKIEQQIQGVLGNHATRKTERQSREANVKASKSYVLISPCRDEADYMRQTLDSVVAQSVRPARWIIVDDGSTDETPKILAEYTSRHDWIEIVTRSDRGKRAVGPGVIEAFYAGLDAINLDDFEYLCKLDLDLEIPSNYFERVIEQMEANPRQANYSGKPYLREKDGRLTSERLGDENAVGQIKLYRITAFKEIGGFVRQVSWDGIDGHMCRMKGWIAQSDDRHELRFIHLRQMGSSQNSIWVGRLRWGFGKYFMGSALYYVAAVAFYRMFEKPYIIGGWGILWGYLKAMFSGVPRFENREFRRFLRRFELRSLLFGKRRTVDQYHKLIQQSQQQKNGPASSALLEL